MHDSGGQSSRSTCNAGLRLKGSPGLFQRPEELLDYKTVARFLRTVVITHLQHTSCFKRVGTCLAICLRSPGGIGESLNVANRADAVKCKNRRGWVLCKRPAWKFIVFPPWKRPSSSMIFDHPFNIHYSGIKAGLAHRSSISLVKKQLLILYSPELSSIFIRHSAQSFTDQIGSKFALGQCSFHEPIDFRVLPLSWCSRSLDNFIIVQSS